MEGRSEEEGEGREEIPGRHIVWALPSSLPGTRFYGLKTDTMDLQFKVFIRGHRIYILCVSSVLRKHLRQVGLRESSFPTTRGRIWEF